MSSVVCRQFSLGEIEDATKNFEKILGHGGEGMVYLGQISAIGSVAVKRLKSNIIEFEEEIDLVSKIKHPNLVSLHGYCEESSQKILVYEYMGKGSLSDYISKKTTSAICLSWQKRLNICLGAARGLQHLHKETEKFPKGIIHRDIKPHNILLDDNWVAKVSDFGLCKLSHADQLKSTMITVLKGTGGYYAPEYVKYGSLTRKVDVYAFGVVLFHVLCRKMPWDRGDESYYRMEDEDLGLWALENVDPEIIEEISEDCLEVYTRIIARCLQIDPSIRPTMEEVVIDLECVLKCQDSQHEGTHPKPPNRARKVLIPGSAQKTIEKIKETNIKEITETNENEIYAMLKECSMDPVKTIQKLVMRGREIKAIQRQRKLYTNNPNKNREDYSYNMWSNVELPIVTFETLAIDSKLKEEIMFDLTAFSNGKNYYDKIGKAWKRRYLLYGPPGTGKSTLIVAMANYMDYDIYNIELTMVRDNSELRMLLINIGSKSLIVIEDGKGYGDGESKVTISGLLNIIDGLWSSCEGERIIVFTTNDVDKLDLALVRRGRMDKHIELSYCSFEAFKILAKNHLDIESHPLFESIRELLESNKMTPADVAENLTPRSFNGDVKSSLENLVQALENLEEDTSSKRGCENPDRSKLKFEGGPEN